MAERKGQEELHGREEGEERREGELMGRWVEDSGTESGEERKGVEEAVQEVKGALERLATALPRLAGNLGGSVSDLVAKLQNCLSTPAPPPRKNKRRHHTVGVTPEEIAKARKWANRPHPQSITRCEFKPVEQKAGYFIEPLPQLALVTYNSAPTLNDAPPLTYDPSVALFTPAQSVQIAVHKAAIQKQISQEESKVNKKTLQRHMSQEELRREGSDSELSSSDEDISPARRLLKLASKRKVKSKIKRSNTVEISRPNVYCDSDTDDPAYSSDRSDLKRKSCGALFSQPPTFLPKTDNDLKFLDFLNKVNDSNNKVISYNPCARGGKHWSNRFSRIKTAFEDQSSDEKEKEIIPKGKTSPFPQYNNNYVQQKLPWSVKQEGDVVVGSITVAKRAPGPVNQFTHAPLSAFKPVEKKTFPSSVSGSVKQLASQKFTPQSEITKPVPTVPPRNHSKFQPLPGPECSPLSQRFHPNKAVQQHPPVQAYLNQFSPDYSPKHFSYATDKVPFKTPTKNPESKPTESPKETVVKPTNLPSHVSSNHNPKVSHSQKKSDHQERNQNKKHESITKPFSDFNQSTQSAFTSLYNNPSSPPQHQAQKPVIEIPSKPPSFDQPIQTQDNFIYQNSDHYHQKSKPDPPPKPFSYFTQPAKLPDESKDHSKHLLTSDYNSNWTNQNYNQSKSSLSPPRDNRDSESLSPHPYKGCYVYNENNEIISKSPFLAPNNANFHVPAAPSQEPIYQNISQVKLSQDYVHSPDMDSNALPSFQQFSHNLSVNGFQAPDKSPLSHHFSENGNAYSREHTYDDNHIIQDPYQKQRLVSSSPKIDSSSYHLQSNVYNPLSPSSRPFQSHDEEIKNLSNYYPIARKGSQDSLTEYLRSVNYSPDYKTTPHVVYNNCSNGRSNDRKPVFSSSVEALDRLSPGFSNPSDVNSRGDSPRGSEDWDDYIEEKAVVGRVMGEAQSQRAVTQSRRVESRFPNAPPSTSLLRAPPEQSKLPSPILRPRQDHSPKAVSPSFPNVLHKSESWHQMVKEQMMQAKQAPPLPAKVVKTKSNHTLALPKQFEGSLHPEAAHRIQSTVSQYFAKSTSPNMSPPKKSHQKVVQINSDDIENVDEAFENIFKECNQKK